MSNSELLTRAWDIQPTEALVANGLHGSPTVFGRNAVEGLYEHADAAAAGSPYADYEFDRAQRTLEIDREYARATSDRSAAIMGERMELDALPPVLHAALTGGEPLEPAALFRRLGDQSAVPDATVFNVVEWHNIRMAVRQERFEQREAPQLKERYLLQVATAVRTGHLPAAALMQSMQRFDAMQLWLDDGSDTQVTNAVATASMNHDGTYRVVLGPESDQHTITHEFGHVAAGEDEKAVKEYPFNREDHAGLTRLFGASALGRLLNEGIVDHVASSLENGHFDITDVTHASRSNVRYKLAEKLLHAFSEAGVPVKLFIDAYYESGSERDRLGADSAAAKLTGAFATAYPHRDIVADVSSMTSAGRNSENRDLGEKYLKVLHREARLAKCRAVLGKLSIFGQK